MIRRRCLLMIGLLSTTFSLAALAAPVALTSGADDEISISAGSTASRYFRLRTDDDHLKLKAEGPIVLAVRFRALTGEPASGLVRILRDDGPYSDNPYKASPDASASADPAAKVANNAVSVERVIYVHVGEGTHRYSISALRGPPLALRLFKVPGGDPKFDAQPEKNIWTGASQAPMPSAMEPVVTEAPRPAVPEKKAAPLAAPSVPPPAPAVPPDAGNPFADLPPIE